MRPLPLGITWMGLLILAVFSVIGMGSFVLQTTAKQDVTQDEYPINYYATKNWLLNNRSLYDPENGKAITGNPGKNSDNLSNERIKYFRYPFMSASIFVPFTYLSMVTGKAVWMAISIMCLVAGSLLILVRQPQKHGTATFVILALFGAVNYYSIHAIMTGSILPLLFMIIMSVSIMLDKRSDTWAGIFSTFILIYFQYGFLVVIFLIWWAFKLKRRRFLRSFLAALLFELAISLIIAPTWMVGWLTSIIKDITISGRYASLLSILVGIDHPEGKWFSLILHLGLILVLLATASSYKYQDSQEFIWVIALTMVVTYLIVFPYMPGGQILCLPALLMVTSTWISRLEKQGSTFLGAVIATLVLLPWLFNILNDKYMVLYLQGLFFAIVGLIGLRWIRWWMLQPKY